MRTQSKHLGNIIGNSISYRYNLSLTQKNQVLTFHALITKPFKGCITSSQSINDTFNQNIFIKKIFFVCYIHNIQQKDVSYPNLVIQRDNMDTIRILLYFIAVVVINQHKIKGEEDFEIDIRKYQGNGNKNIPN